MHLKLTPLDASAQRDYCRAALRRNYHVEPSLEGFAVYLEPGEAFVAGVSIHSTEGRFVLVEDLVADVPTDLSGARIIHRAVGVLIDACLDYAVGRNKILRAVVPASERGLRRMLHSRGWGLQMGLPMWSMPKRRVVVGGQPQHTFVVPPTTTSTAKPKVRKKKGRGK